jgi:putative membrane protein
MNYLIEILRGVVIGIANIIPGVSGGTMAVILGNYEKLTTAIGELITNKRKFKENFFFLLLIFIGVIIGILIFAKLFVILFKINIAKQLIFIVFLGLILGSIPLIIKIHNDMKPNFIRILIFLASFSALFLTSFFGTNKSAISNLNIEITGQILNIFNLANFNIFYLIWLFIVGFFAALAMILPGFSGSALLVSLGEYSNILYYIDNRLILPLFFFGIGVLPGIFVASKIISKLLQKYPSNMYYFILGLILGSAYQVFTGIVPIFENHLLSYFLSIFAIAFGFLISLSLSRINN